MSKVEWIELGNFELNKPAPKGLVNVKLNEQRTGFVLKVGKPIGLSDEERKAREEKRAKEKAIAKAQREAKRKLVQEQKQKDRKALIDLRKKLRTEIAKATKLARKTLEPVDIERKNSLQAQYDATFNKGE